ncbi:MAG: aldehyde ferredoxin oxidoreductase N-terminal domain-containing protein [Promethearchaeota archaeon]
MEAIPQDILEINLSNQKTKRYSRPELFSKWLGGIGVAVNLLQEHVPSNADPLGKDNAIIFAIGPLSTFYPIVSKTVAVFRSPLTGDLGESYAGGRLSLAMRFTGLGAIIIKGQAEKTSYISIIDEKVDIKRAGPLAYMYTSTLGKILRELIPEGPGRRSSIRIGQASENLVKYGNAIVDSYRHFGRLGVGAVLGAKRIKAIVICGSKDISLDSPNINRHNYVKTYKNIWERCVNTDSMRKYHVLGTPQSILPLNEMNSLPTKNFKLGKFERAEDISGEKFVETYLGRRVSCNTCPVGCIHVAILRERYGVDSPADLHSIAVPYDYEPMYALGPILEIGDGIELLKLIEQTERLGMDAITTGLILGWMAEAYEKRLLSNEDTQGLPIRFGNVNDFITIIKRIAYRHSEDKDLFWYAGEGLDQLIEIYGGGDFAVRFNNNPPAGYSTGSFSMLGHAIGARHSHLDNAGYSLDQKIFDKPLGNSMAVLKLVKEEEWRNVLNSLIICLFARNIYTPEMVVECLQNLGIDWTEEKLFRLGSEIQTLRIKTKIRYGFDYDRLIEKVPKRIYEMPTAHGNISETKFKNLFNTYKVLLNDRYSI